MIFLLYMKLFPSLRKTETEVLQYLSEIENRVAADENFVFIGLVWVKIRSDMNGQYI